MLKRRVIFDTLPDHRPKLTFFGYLIIHYECQALSLKINQKLFIWRLLSIYTPPPSKWRFHHSLTIFAGIILLNMFLVIRMINNTPKIDAKAIHLSKVIISATLFGFLFIFYLYFPRLASILSLFNSYNCINKSLRPYIEANLLNLLNF